MLFLDSLDDNIKQVIVIPSFLWSERMWLVMCHAVCSNPRSKSIWENIRDAMCLMQLAKLRMCNWHSSFDKCDICVCVQIQGTISSVFFVYNS